MTLHGKCFIDGTLRRGSAGTKRAVNASNGQELDPPFSQAGDAEAEAALIAADKALAPFGELSAARRAAFLENIASRLEGCGEGLLQRAHEETALPLARLDSERGRTCAQLRLFAQVVREGSWVDARIDQSQPGRKPLPRPDLRRMLVSLGPVVVFGSSNFPLAFSVAGGDTASALAAGCPVVFKAHSAHPGTSEWAAEALCEAARESGVPPGVFSLLHGEGRLIGPALVAHPLAKAVGFTGSRAAGRALFDTAAARPAPIPVFAEMASINPLFLLPSALREQGGPIASGLKASVTLGVGQFCTKPGVIFAIESPELEAFLGILGSELKTVAPAPMLHTSIREAFQAGVARMTGLPGVSLLATGQSPSRGSSLTAATVAVVNAASFLQNPHGMAEEVFGPFCLVVKARNWSEILEAARALDGQLTCSVFAGEEDGPEAEALSIILRHKAGRLLRNGFPTGVEVCAAMTHGGPYPATTDPRFTSVGTAAMLRFARPVTFQDFPDSALPPELQSRNPLGIRRFVDSVWTASPL